MSAAVLPVAVGATTAAATSETFDPAVHSEWRGWVAYQQEVRGPRQHDLRRSWAVDIDRGGGNGQWEASNYSFQDNDPCLSAGLKREAFGRGQGTTLTERNGVSEGSPLPGTSYPAGAPTIGFVAEYEGNFSETVHYKHCDGPFNESFPGFPASWAIYGAPGDYRDPPLTVYEDSSWEDPPSPDSPTVLHRAIVCMSRSAADADRDGLPDEVDLDPLIAGSPLGLGHPNGSNAWDVAIPAKLQGGPDGERGLPSCPARPGAEIAMTLDADLGVLDEAGVAVTGALGGLLRVDGERIEQNVSAGVPAVLTARAADGVVIDGITCNAAALTTVQNDGATAVLTLTPAPGEYIECRVAVGDYPVRYAPAVRIHPDEKHRPMSASAFVTDSELFWSANLCGDEAFPEARERDLGAGTVSWGPGACGPGGPAKLYSTTDYTRPGDPRCSAELIQDAHRCKDPDLDETEGFFLDLSNDRRTGAGVEDISAGRVPAYYEYVAGQSLTYWFAYGNSIPSSGGNGAWVFSHEGDWEHVVVHLNEFNAPTGMTWYYHHWNSEDVPSAPKDWDAVPKDPSGYPLVYAALEGHGSYWSTDCDFTQPNTDDFIRRTLDQCSASGPTWETARNLKNARTQPWYGFGGAWGQTGALSGDEQLLIKGNTSGPPGPGSPPMGCSACRERFYEDVPAQVDAVPQGGRFTVTSAGWPGNTPLTFTLHSEPILLAEATANDSGEIRLSLEVPLSAPPGVHEVQVVGNVATGLDRVVRMPLSVTAASDPPPSVDRPTARNIDSACPLGRVPSNPFSDVPAASTHERAISCLVWWKVANGRTADTFAPVARVTRDAMAAFVARTLLQAKPGSLSDSPADAFRDDGDSIHQKAINQLAAAGIVGGTGSGLYSPAAGVTRGQMARFLANAAKHLQGQPLPIGGDLFTDDNGSLFEGDINRVAQAGLTGGRADGTYDAPGPVLRDQMGSFLARTLDLFVVQSGANLPQ